MAGSLLLYLPTSLLAEGQPGSTYADVGLAGAGWQRA